MRPISDFNPDTDQREFRRCLSQFATGVTVITAASAGRWFGLTANSFSSLSLDPPLILWSISKSSSRYLIFDSATDFVVNVLSDHQATVSRHFATAGEDKFAGAGWTPGQNGAPILDEAAAFLECKRVGEYDAGDHRILIGQVLRAARFDRTPLLFSQGAYRVPADHPDDRTQQDAAGWNSDAANMEATILSDLFRANHKLAAAFARFRDGLTRDEHRILISVERKPGLPASEVGNYSFLGTHAAEDALGMLLEKGLLRENGNGGLDLTEAGRERRGQLLKHLDNMERQLLADMPPGTARAAHELLHHLASD